MKSRMIFGLVIVMLAGVIWMLFLKEGGEPVLNAPPSKPGIVAFGDTLTRGVGAEDGRGYPEQLSEMLGREVVNLGLSGETTKGALARLSQVLDYDPGVVLITLGGNDLKNGVPKEEAFHNLRRIVTRFQESGAMVVVGAIEVPFYSKGYPKGYRTLAQETGAALVPNVYDGVLGTPSLMSDTIHPNAKGYAIMAQHFYGVLSPLLQP